MSFEEIRQQKERRHLRVLQMLRHIELTGITDFDELVQYALAEFATSTSGAKDLTHEALAKWKAGKK